MPTEYFKSSYIAGISYPRTIISKAEYSYESVEVFIYVKQLSL